VRQPRAFRRQAHETDGLGLMLLDRLADHWGSKLLPDGSTLVSFEIRAFRRKGVSARLQSQPGLEPLDVPGVDYLSRRDTGVL
jgi:hypothetical protein